MSPDSDPYRPMLDRRELLGGALRAGLGAVVGLGVPAALVACGGDSGLNTQSKAVAGRSIAIDYASFYAPFADLHRLVLARARQTGESVTFSNDAQGSPAQLASLRTLTGDRGGFRVVVVAAFDAPAVEPIAAAALKRGVAVVSYVTPLAHRTTAIEVDPAATAALLAQNAAGWARVHLGGAGSVLLVVPPSGLAVPDPFLAGAARSEPVIRRTLAAQAPGLRVVATTAAYGTPDAHAAVALALNGHPATEMVLCWNDATAVGAAQALRERRPGAAQDRLYAGGQGVPAVTSRQILAQLRAGGVLRCLIAPRLRDLADALVDVPRLILGNRTPPPVSPALTALTATSPELVAFERDYTA